MLLGSVPVEEGKEAGLGRGRSQTGMYYLQSSGVGIALQSCPKLTTPLKPQIDHH